MNIQLALKKFGFSDKQSLIYLTLIKKIEASAYLLSKETGIPRATMYEHLENLKAQGIISSSRVNGTLVFTAESPKHLLKLLKEKEEVMNQIMPNLLALSSKKEFSPSVKLYLGKEGSARVLDDIIETLKQESQKTLYTIAGTILRKDRQQFLLKWINLRRKHNIQIKLIDYVTSHVRYEHDPLRETRLIDDKYCISSDVDIYANKVAIFSEIDGKEYTIIMESPSVSETFRKFHQFMWDHAKIHH